MKRKEEMATRWADLSRRFGDDPELGQVVDSIEKAVPKEDAGSARPRLKVPYANATTLDNGTGWN
jgi:hypothetical protein